MLTPPTKEALIALDQVTKFPRWGDVEKLIEAELKAILDRMLGTREAADLHELRGRAKALKELQQMWRDAADTLKKMGQTSPL
jgi:hypothetical protein